jgi:hypothetical protein
MKNKSINLTLGDVADICGIVALPLALGFAPWLVTIAAVFLAGLLARPYVDSLIGKK